VKKIPGKNSSHHSEFIAVPFMDTLLWENSS